MTGALGDLGQLAALWRRGPIAAQWIPTNALAWCLAAAVGEYLNNSRLPLPMLQLGGVSYGSLSAAVAAATGAALAGILTGLALLCLAHSPGGRRETPD